MARLLVIEEFHLTVFVSRDLPDPEADAVRQGLADPAFEARLRRAVRRLFRREPALSKAKVRLSR